MASGLTSVDLRGTTDSGGDATITSDKGYFGLLYAVEWVDGDLVDGVDCTISCTETESGVDQTLLTLTNANDDAWYFPRETEDDNTGAAATATVMAVVNGKLEAVISSGGDTKTGGAIVYLLPAG